MKLKDAMHIALGFDQNYLVHFYALAASIFNNNAPHKFIFHAIATGLSEADKEKVENYIASQGGELRFYEVSDDFAAGFTAHGWYGRATFYRLLFASILPVDIKRFLYLDTDIIVVGDLGKIYHVDMQGFPLAAVPEPAMEPRPELGMPEGSSYFSSGVLLIDREKWVAQKVSERALDFLDKNHKITVYVDQDALNATLVGNWRILEPKFNLMPDYIPRTLRKKNYESFLKDQVIIHYTQFYKPWHVLCNNKLRHLYYRYLRTTPVGANSKPGGFEFSSKVLMGILKIKVREFYYNYPLVPVSVTDKLRKVAK